MSLPLAWVAARARGALQNVPISPRGAPALDWWQSGRAARARPRLWWGSVVQVSPHGGCTEPRHRPQLDRLQAPAVELGLVQPGLAIGRGSHWPQPGERAAVRIARSWAAACASGYRRCRSGRPDRALRSAWRSAHRPSCQLRAADGQPSCAVLPTRPARRRHTGMGHNSVKQSGLQLRPQRRRTPVRH